MWDSYRIIEALQHLAREQAAIDPEKAVQLARFFKTGNGEYAEGDTFLGITIPQQRALVRRIVNEGVSLEALVPLLADIDPPVHEYRMTALLILVQLAEEARKSERKKVRFGDPRQELELQISYAACVEFYFAYRKYINNWDLVDVTCHKVLGPWFMERDRQPLIDLAVDGNLWEQRIAIITTYAFIKAGDLTTTFEIAELLLDHPHDLIHKAVGWMLREAGKQDPSAEREFLQDRYRTMPRTMLRYAIEKFPETERKAYLHGEI